MASRARGKFQSGRKPLQCHWNAFTGSALTAWKGIHLLGYVAPGMFILKINLIVLMSHLLFSLEHCPLILFLRARTWGIVHSWSRPCQGSTAISWKKNCSHAKVSEQELLLFLWRWHLCRKWSSNLLAACLGQVRQKVHRDGGPDSLQLPRCESWANDLLSLCLSVLCETETLSHSTMEVEQN